MSRVVYNKFNRGEVDRKAICRQDVDRIKNSGSLMSNFWPVRLGPMSFRPGIGYLGAVGSRGYCVPFVASTDDTAVLEFTDGYMRVWVNDAVIQRTATTDTITNGTFLTDLSGWTATAGATWISGSYARLVGDGTTEASITQMVTVGQPNVSHPMRVTIVEAPVRLRIGYSSGGTDILDTVLLPGTHSLNVIPTGNFYIQLANVRTYRALVDQVVFEATGDMQVPTGISEANLHSIRFAESVDVVFLTYSGGIQKRIERRGTTSWSIVDYRCDDGPFEAINTSTITLQAGAFTGNTTLTASRAFFKTGHVGALFQLVSSEQNRLATAAAQNVATESVRVIGVGATRTVTINITGTFVATVTLQQSADNATWSDITTYTTPISTTYNDGSSNAILYYRLIVKTGNYTSGSVTMQIQTSSGSITGTARVVSYTSPTVVNVQVVSDFGSTQATVDWYEGSWSPERGYPDAVALFEGRLFFAGKNKVWGSVSDVFDSFDINLTGNSNGIIRTIGFGPADNVNWLQATSRLFMGIVSDCVTIGSSAFGEILTSNNATLRSGSTQGAADNDSVKSDNRLYFVQRSKRKLFQVAYSVESDATASEDLNVLTPGLCTSNIVRIAVTRQPETRVFVVLEDGTVRVYLHEPTEDVKGWSRMSSPYGLIEDVVVLPGTSEDFVYFIINTGSTRVFTKMAMSSESLGALVSKHYDGFLVVTPGSDTITGLSHLNGKTVAVWGNGRKLGTGLVAGGQVTVAGSSGYQCTVGMEYTAQYTSNKLTDYIKAEVYNDHKRVVRLGLVLEYAVPSALKYGSDFNHLDALPKIEGGKLVDQNVTLDTYDELTFAFNGTYDTDSRFCLQATAPVTVLCAAIEIDDPTARTINKGSVNVQTASQNGITR